MVYRNRNDFDPALLVFFSEAKKKEQSLPDLVGFFSEACEKEGTKSLLSSVKRSSLFFSEAKKKAETKKALKHSSLGLFFSEATWVKLRLTQKARLNFV